MAENNDPNSTRCREFCKSGEKDSECENHFHSIIHVFIISLGILTFYVGYEKLIKRVAALIGQLDLAANAAPIVSAVLSSIIFLILVLAPLVIGVVVLVSLYRPRGETSLDQVERVRGTRAASERVLGYATIIAVALSSAVISAVLYEFFREQTANPQSFGTYKEIQKAHNSRGENSRRNLVTRFRLSCCTREICVITRDFPGNERRSHG